MLCDVLMFLGRCGQTSLSETVGHTSFESARLKITAVVSGLREASLMKICRLVKLIMLMKYTGHVKHVNGVASFFK